MHAFTVTKQYFILLQLLTRTQKNSLTSHYCSPIQITVQEESEKWKLKFLLYSPQMLLSGEIWSLLVVAVILLKAAAPGWYACLYVCVWELSGCCAAPVACWHCPNVSASRLHFCRLGRLPDSCFGIALRFLTETSQVSSPDSHCFFLSLSLSPLAVSLPLAAPVHVCPLSSPELGFFRLLCGVWGSSLLPVSWWSCGAERAQALVSQSQKN